MALENGLRQLEGLPPLGSAAPRPTQDPQPKPAPDPAAIAAWHTANDPALDKLRTAMATDCKGLPQATTPPPPYDLVITGIDDNGIPLDPVWQSTVTPPYTLPNPSQCGTEPWQYPCTTMQTEINNNRGLCPTGDLGGHANWMLATFAGRIFWDSKSNSCADLLGNIIAPGIVTDCDDD